MPNDTVEPKELDEKAKSMRKTMSRYPTFEAWAKACLKPGVDAAKFQKIYSEVKYEPRR